MVNGDSDLITSSSPPGRGPCGRSAFTVKFLCVEKDKSRCRTARGRRSSGRGLPAEGSSPIGRRSDVGVVSSAGYKYSRAGSLPSASEATSVTDVLSLPPFPLSSTPQLSPGPPQLYLQRGGSRCNNKKKKERKERVSSVSFLLELMLGPL